MAEAVHTPTSVGWTDPPSPPSGNDQLGLRESSESQYTRLIDFTTSVTWHPRYYGFLCWALREAYERFSETIGDRVRLDVRAQQTQLRRRDYAMAAATLAASRDLRRVIGVDRIGAIVDEMGDGGRLEVRDDHVGGGTGAGSFGVYAGPMTNLGLLDDARPSERGDRLADAFAAVLKASGAGGVFEHTTIPRVELAEAGKVIGLGQLNDAARTQPTVATERDVLRSIIVEWGGASAPGRVRRRILSIGIILALHDHAEGAPLEEHHFREAILLGGLRGFGNKAFGLPPVYGGVLGSWHLYQAHANVVLALEAFLALALEALRVDGRASVPREEALDAMLGWLRQGWAEPAFPRSLAFDPDESLAGAVERLRPALGLGWRAPEAEPDLAGLLTGQWPALRDPALAMAAAASLLVWSEVRLREAQDTFREAWLKPDVEAWRLPPATLVARLRSAVAAGQSVADHVRLAAGDLAISGHARNSRRKLLFQPDRFTARLLENAGRLEFMTSHTPGTSSPRYDNAVSYLEALGYLEAAGASGGRHITTDGQALATEIEARAGAWA